MSRMRKAVAGIVVLLLLAGAATGFFFFEKHRGRDVRGSTTEFVPALVPSLRTPASSIVWPMFGYDAARLHVAPDVRLRPPFKIGWVSGGRTLLEFPPAIAEGRLYLATGGGHLLAVSVRDGSRAWDVDIKRCAAASPAVGPHAHGTVYETFLNKLPCKNRNAKDGEIIALSVGTRKLHWSRHIGASETSPLLVGHHLYVGDWLGKIYDLDANNGRLYWTYQAHGAIKSGIAWSGGRLFFGSYDGHIYALNAKTGKLVWRASGDPRLFHHGNFYSTPAVAYGRVYIGSTDGKVYSFGASSGKRRWSHSTGSYVYGSPAVWDQRVYVGSYDGYFYAFNAETGDIVWRYHANGPISGSATVVDGVVYFATLKHKTYALNARTGKFVWSFADGHYSPVVADSTHVFLIGYGTIYGLVPR
jgi:outer membrane protein assembly factor BamB